MITAARAFFLSTPWLLSIVKMTIKLAGKEMSTGRSGGQPTTDKKTEYQANVAMEDMRKYRIAAQIGAGKYSDVFLVFNDEAQAYAMKLMKNTYFNSESTKESWQRYLIGIHEFIKQKKIPHTLKPVAYGKLPPEKEEGDKAGRLVLLFPLLLRPITGDELLDLEPKCKKSILSQIWDMFVKIHEVKCYHLNLDPSNVLVDRWSVTGSRAHVFVIGWSVAHYPKEKKLVGKQICTEGKQICTEVGLPQWRFLTSLAQSDSVDVGERADAWRFQCFTLWLLGSGKDPILDKPHRWIHQDILNELIRVKYGEIEKIWNLKKFEGKFDDQWQQIQANREKLHLK